MSRLSVISWAAINLVAGLLLTFLAPTLSAVIAQPLAIVYLLSVAILFGSVAVRAGVKKHFRFLLIAAASLVIGVLLAIFPFSNSIDAYQQVVSHWALIQGLLLLFISRSHKANVAYRRDLLIVSVTSLAAAAVLYIPVTNLRDVLGFFSAYLLITGVLLGIAGASEPK